MNKTIGKYLLLAYFCLQHDSLYAQFDTLYLHNGNVEPASVLRVNMHTIAFKYKNEDAERNMGKIAIQKIVYRSGRVEFPSVRHEVPPDSLWKKVIVIRDLSETEGLTKVDIIQSHTAFINLHTSSTGERTARKKLYKKAIEMNCPFVFIIEDKEILYGTIKFWGVSQHKFKAIAYRY